jgi:hypothetical protein
MSELISRLKQRKLVQWALAGFDRTERMSPATGTSRHSPYVIAHGLMMEP